MEWYRKTAKEIFDELKTSESGLSSDSVKVLLTEQGFNVLPEEKLKSFRTIFITQFANPLVYILLIASIVVFAMGDTVDAAVIMVALLINAVVGSIQEGRAQDKLSALKKFSETAALVLRDSIEIIIPDKELVAGDIIILREGAKVPADARLLEVNNFKVDEAAITGESEPVLKGNEPIDKSGITESDQKNMVFKGTLVVSGHAKAVVTATGRKTVVGKIAAKLSSIDSGMPIKRDIGYLSKVILLATISVVSIIFIIGILKGFGVREMFTTSIAIAVSAIPEGLPVVLTVVLATGVSRMSNRNVLVKRLQAVEALGQAKIIAVDKTGTITYNQMMVSTFYTNGKYFEVTGSGYEPKGDILFGGKVIEPLAHNEVLAMARSGILTTDAKIAFSNASGRWERVSGDPTEVALVTFAAKVGFKINATEEEYPKLLEVPFDSRLKFHATINLVDNSPVLSIVGAPEVIVKKTDEIWKDGKSVRMDENDRKEIAAALKTISREGLRVLAVAMNINGIDTLNPEELPELCFLGFFGISDAIRPEVHEAVLKTKAAGMKVVMITGDHAETAEAIAKKAGIFKEGDEIILGDEIESMDIPALALRIGRVSVFARVSPEHKLKIIEAYRHRKETIAMTGDGVNDAMSLAAADLGVSMGKIGTEVAKEASDLVLMDDNFGSIVTAVEEGRNIYRTIQKVILYLFSTSVGEILAISLAIIMGYPLLLTPSQIIWLNLVTDGFLVIALAMEPKEINLLKRGFKLTKGFLVDMVGLERILLMGTVMTLGVMVLFNHYLAVDPLKATTVALTLLSVFQWFNAWNCRSAGSSLFGVRPWENKYLLWATAAVFILQLLALHMVFFQNVLHTVPLSLYDWTMIILVGSVIVLAEEFRKIVYRARVSAKGSSLAAEFHESMT